MKRSLAAVLAADVVGYSELMNENSETAFSALKRLRSEVFGPAVASNHGRIVKSMGDGWIVVFGAAVEAANCALQIHERSTSDNTDIDPKMLLRLGVHLGDLIEYEHDVFGDGVNIAARLEKLALPGSIAISDAVFSSLDGTLRPAFDDAGEQNLKNISLPVRVWTRGASSRAPASDHAKTDKPRLVIKPLETSDKRAEVLELAEALTGDLLTYLGAAHWLTPCTTQVDDKAYVITGRLRAQSRRLRLETMLKSPAGQELWSGKVDGDLNDAFAWQDDAAETISAQILARVFESERRHLDKLSVSEMTANQCELRGQLALDRMDPASFASALEFSSFAIQKDPSSPHSLALGLVSYLSATVMGYHDVAMQYSEKVPCWCEAAIQLDSDYALLNLALGVTNYARNRDPIVMRQIVRLALRQSPADLTTLALSGWAYIWTCDNDAALDCLTKALRLGEFSPWSLSIRGGLSLASVQAGDNENAILFATEGLSISADYATLHRVLAAAYAHLGHEKRAEQAVKAALQADPEGSIQSILSRNFFADANTGSRYICGLRLAGMPE